MSGLVTSGNTVNNFGKYLPAPYIKQIYIGVATDNKATVEVDLDVYIHADANADTITLLEELESVKVYVYMFDGGDVNIESLLNNETSIWDAIMTSSAPGQGIDIIKYPDSGEPEIIYDENGTRTLKLTSRQDFTVESSFEWGTEDYYLVAFSTTQEYVTGAGGTDIDDLVSGDHLTTSQWNNFVNLETSDIAYELIYSNNQVGGGEEVIWTDLEGNLFDGTGMQSLTSQYHDNASLSNAELVTSFEDLLEEFTLLGETDAELKDSMDQVSYILTTSANSSELLVDLNELARAFPSKTTATNTGALYERLQQKIYTANAVIEEGTLIQKRVFNNAKVTDNRGLTAGEDSFNYPIYYKDGPWKQNFNYKVVDANDDDTSVYDSDYLRKSDAGKYFNGDHLFDRRELASSGGGVGYYDEDIYIHHGYFFFDYEKALYETAKVGDYLHMRTLLDFLGIDVLKQYYGVLTAKYERFVIDTDDLIVRLTTTFDKGYEPTETTHEVDSDGDGYSQGTPLPWVSDTDANYAYSFLLMRNFQVSKEDGLDGYRMMCFEMQDFEAGQPYFGTTAGTGGSPVDDNTDTVFSVTIKDETYELIRDLISEYSGEISNLQDYADTSALGCNYNEDTNAWTPEYIEEQLTTYADNPGEAPWVYYPLYYTFHVDLVSKIYNGDKDAIIEAANTLASQIGPEYGSLIALQSFVLQFEEFYNANYTGDSTLGTINDDTSFWPAAEEVEYVSADLTQIFYNASYDIDSAGGTTPTTPWHAYPYASTDNLIEAAAYPSSAEDNELAPPTVTIEGGDPLRDIEGNRFKKGFMTPTGAETGIVITIKNEFFGGSPIFIRADDDARNNPPGALVPFRDWATGDQDGDTVLLDFGGNAESLYQQTRADCDLTTIDEAAGFNESGFYAGSLGSPMLEITSGDPKDADGTTLENCRFPNVEVFYTAHSDSEGNEWDTFTIFLQEEETDSVLDDDCGCKSNYGSSDDIALPIDCSGDPDVSYDTEYTLTWNPGSAGLLDRAGNALENHTITFTAYDSSGTHCS